MMKTYLYHGPTTALELKSEGKAVFEGVLVHKKTILLPEDHPHVVSLAAQQLLKKVPEQEITEIPVQEEERPARSKKKDNSNGG